MPTDVENWKSEVYGNEIREHLFRFAEEGWDAIPDDEHDAWFERFKWWGLYHQRNGQESFFMMRIGTPNGVLKPGQTEVVAEIAEKYAEGPEENPIFGNGWVDWTTRQSIQLHWIKLEDVPEIFEKLESVGLSTQQACGESGVPGKLPVGRIRDGEYRSYDREHVVMRPVDGRPARGDR